MAFLADSVLDGGSQVLTDDVDILHICSAEPANFAGIAAVTLGNKPSPTVGSPANGASSGRRVTISAITDGEVTGTDTATHWVLADAAGSVLLAANTLASSQAVTDGNTFTLDAFDITIPDPS